MHLIEVFLIFGKKIFDARYLKRCYVDFHKICSAGTSELRDEQCKFMFKSDCKILRYGCFKIIPQACPG